MILALLSAVTSDVTLLLAEDRPAGGQGLHWGGWVEGDSLLNVDCGP